ncbi:MAG TPA: DUF2891 family protein [Kofleriaceae bacterium]|nr:DUF2891 family protein [Kofleriaceae bacterium]
MFPSLDEATARAIAALVSANLHRPLPYKPGHVVTGPADLRAPRELTPIFYGCFDWHSAVHSYWSVACLARRFGGADWAEALRPTLAAAFTAEHVQAERAFLAAHPGFETPYGIAWLLELGTELGQHPALAAIVEPWVADARAIFAGWLSRLPAPIRSGEHSQSAFAMTLARDHAVAIGDDALRVSIDDRARAMYGADRDAPLAYEPSAYDFLSPALGEAALMARVLSAAEYASWLIGFLPAPRFEPVIPIGGPSTAAQGKLAHWAGLNLSRAWMLRRCADALRASQPDAPLGSALEQQAAAHLAAGRGVLTSTEYEQTHWVGSFLLYALR